MDHIRIELGSPDEVSNGTEGIPLIINSIFTGSDKSTAVALDDLGPDYDISPKGASAYRRFYGLSAVNRCEEDLFSMLGDTLRRALSAIPDASGQPGQLIYCKTQTHNTFGADGWLRELADAHGLSRWEAFSVTMTNCASATVAMHFLNLSATDGPIVLITGEKAFHPGVSVLSVGLLSELPTASVFNADGSGWQMVESHVQHLGEFYENPDQMQMAARKRLQEVYAPALCHFVEDCLSKYEPYLRHDTVLIPHNLNLPVMRAIVRQIDWEDRVYYGDVAHHGHAYCSDLLLNLDRWATAQDETLPEQVILVAAGTGVTFASCLLERRRLS